VPEFADARRIAAVDFEVIARTLRRRIALRTTDLAVYEAMQYLACDPEIEGYPARHSVIRIDRDRGVYRIVENDRILHEQVHPRAVVEYLFGQLFEQSLQDDPKAPLIHAACLRRHNRRLLLVGDKGAGKTTLTLRLMLAGYDVEGDENVFVFGEAAVVRPRALHVKQPALRLLPELADAISRRPYLEDYLGQRIYNVDPRCLGSSWQIRHAPIDLVILLRANHGGYSSIRPVPPLALVRDIMLETGLPPSERGAAIGAVIAMCARAKGFDLSLGDHAGAIRCIDAACASLE
jgi:hypothetical protein